MAVAIYMDNMRYFVKVLSLPDHNIFLFIGVSQNKSKVIITSAHLLFRLTFLITCLLSFAKYTVSKRLSLKLYLHYEGDGETPTFAESMVLQKAKRYAIEEAGTSRAIQR